MKMKIVEAILINFCGKIITYLTVNSKSFAKLLPEMG